MSFDLFESTLSEFPDGAICIWTNTTIPSGWMLCNGSNGTPNLLNMFVMGAEYAAIGETGGSESASISAHTHTLAGNYAINAEHNHSFTFDSNSHSHNTVSTSSDGQHNHNMRSGNTDTNGNDDLLRTSTSGTISGAMQSAGSHSHSTSISSAGSHYHTYISYTTPDHTHTLTSGTVGVSGSGENIPPYYTLVYIMKGVSV